MDVAQSHYSACEEQETLALDIIRQGNLAESSFVTVKVIWRGISPHATFTISKVIDRLLIDPFNSR